MAEQLNREIDPIDPILSYQEVARIRGVSVDTVRREVKRGHLAKVQLSLRRVGIHRSEATKSIAIQGSAA